MITIIVLHGGPAGRDRLNEHLGTVQAAAGSPSIHAARLAARLAPLPVDVLAAAAGDWWKRHGAYAKNAWRN